MPVNAAPLSPSDKSLIREGKHREKGKCQKKQRQQEQEQQQQHHRHIALCHI
ncbi:GD11605 [Drosophila simulans]|uniref:GD11605 n=1 Tax=Drosophila simulans TaxID=7240 RepID=B4NVB4_DROSI|nr:GD11605 [Drosophila simulans]